MNKNYVNKANTMNECDVNYKLISMNEPHVNGAVALCISDI